MPGAAQAAAILGVGPEASPETAEVETGTESDNSDRESVEGTEADSGEEMHDHALAEEATNPEPNNGEGDTPGSVEELLDERADEETSEEVLVDQTESDAGTVASADGSDEEVKPD